MVILSEVETEELTVVVSTERPKAAERDVPLAVDEGGASATDAAAGDVGGGRSAGSRDDGNGDGGGRQWRLPGCWRRRGEERSDTLSVGPCAEGRQGGQGNSIFTPPSSARCSLSIETPCAGNKDFDRLVRHLIQKSQFKIVRRLGKENFLHS